MTNQKYFLSLYLKNRKKKNEKNKVNTSAAEQVAEPMIDFLRSKTNKPVENPDLLFFKSLLPDLKKLKGKNRRQFKQFVLTNLNTFINNQETQDSVGNALYHDTTSNVPVGEL